MSVEGPEGGLEGGPDELADRLRGSGYRLTPQRQLVLRAIEELGHATPDDVYHHVRGQASAVNVSTVYRNLEVLEELGMVRHTHLSDRAPTYHSTRDPEHFHLVCRTCRRVRSVDPAVLAPLASVLEAEGFLVDVGHLTVFGHCAECEQTDPGTHPDTHPGTDPGTHPAGGAAHPRRPRLGP